MVDIKMDRNSLHNSKPVPRRGSQTLYRRTKYSKHPLSNEELVPDAFCNRTVTFHSLITGRTITFTVPDTAMSLNLTALARSPTSPGRTWSSSSSTSRRELPVLVDGVLDVPTHKVPSRLSMELLDDARSWQLGVQAVLMSYVPGESVVDIQACAHRADHARPDAAARALCGRPMRSTDVWMSALREYGCRTTVCRRRAGETER
ncbi:hypothetical protein FA95DRAFT_1608340 [Auriscalpium vulgare]|uniref:Uncharacterized protein n=1 Tax=Auriscalpium vulgare TaxID=40419 RepID=A0ACB8RKS8_9AGAM|nr:hypothetical protein FA95DRAFT_1608340 [Auriscalpium vulgare]